MSDTTSIGNLPWELLALEIWPWIPQWYPILHQVCRKWRDLIPKDFVLRTLPWSPQSPNEVRSNGDIYNKRCKDLLREFVRCENENGIRKMIDARNREIPSFGDVIVPLGPMIIEVSCEVNKYFVFSIEPWIPTFNTDTCYQMGCKYNRLDFVKTLPQVICWVEEGARQAIRYDRMEILHYLLSIGECDMRKLFIRDMPKRMYHYLRSITDFSPRIDNIDLVMSQVPFGKRQDVIAGLIHHDNDIVTTIMELCE
uniref:F-box domain-containing protein n=1 Tax=Pithovirus LCPAC304 TaxID=2506594 RepID=A0A481Z9A1_9VIRU|nr:MAG: hypothetical protein LCPAC304_03050 [Pithovirus LCPAC304]